MARLYQLVALLLRRLSSHRGNTFIMFMGLAVSFTFLAVITHYVRSEISYDTFWGDAENKYRLQSTITYPGGSPSPSAQSPFPLLDLVKKHFSEVKTGARLYNEAPSFRYGETLLKEKLSFIDPSFFDIFDIEMMEGSRDNIQSNPSAVILSQSFAQRLFGRAPAMGETFSTVRWDNKIIDRYVTGVFKDLPQNSHLKLSAIALLKTEPDQEKNWRNPRVYTYVALKAGADPSVIEDGLPELEKQAIPLQGNWNIADSFSVKLHAIERLHLFQADDQDMKPPGSVKTVYVYGLVGLLLVLIAGANFVNMMIVRANFRVKEVALRKLYGAQGQGILAEFLPEAVVIALGAYYFSLIGLEVLGSTLFELIGFTGDTSAREMLFSGILVAMIALLLALFSGIYPALKLAQTPPLNALRARTASLTISMKFSRWMMSLQFVIAIAIAIVSGSIWAQINYTQNKDLGYDPSGVLIHSLLGVPDTGDVLMSRFSEVPGVLGVTRSLFAPTEGPLAGFIYNRLTRKKGEDGVEVPVQYVASNFFDVYGITLLAGRVFSSDYAPSPHSGDIKDGQAVLNESAIRQLGFTSPSQAVGKQMWRGNPGDQIPLTIIGVVADTHDTSFRTRVEPIAYYSGGRSFTISVKVVLGEEKAVLDATKTIWQELQPNAVYTGEFLEDRLRAQYGPEYQLMDFLVITGALSILLSCLGLYANSSFLLTKQQKEFAIRKVHGASFQETSRLALGRAVKPAVIAIIFACPLSYFYLENWLSGFVYRIAMPYEMFVLASLVMVLVAVASTYIVVYKVASSRMVELLREE